MRAQRKNTGHSVSNWHPPTVVEVVTSGVPSESVCLPQKPRVLPAGFKQRFGRVHSASTKQVWSVPGAPGPLETW
jgi:hypothetical protein